MDEKLEEDLYRENIKIAPIPARIGAYLIDMLVILLLMTVTLTQSQKDAINQAQITINTITQTQFKQIQLNATPDNKTTLETLRNSLKDAFYTILFYIAVCAGLEIIYNFFFVYLYGATLGQIIVKIKIINKTNFDTPTLHECMKRAVVKYLFGTLLYIGFIIAFTDRFYRTIHDRVSKTIVIINN